MIAFFFFFFFNDTATTEIYTLSLHDALPILSGGVSMSRSSSGPGSSPFSARTQVRLSHCHEEDRQNPARSEEHTSELQSRQYLVCRLLLEKKKITTGCRHGFAFRTRLASNKV